MKITEPECRHPTRAAIDKLAATFSLPNTPDMQDWEWEVADPDRVEEFLNEYKNGNNTDDEKFVLLEMLLQSFEESELDLNKNEKWKELLELIQSNFKIHEYTIWYWSVFDAESKEEQWRVTPFMRELYAKNV
jgi:hypothetical protein